MITVRYPYRPVATVLPHRLVAGVSHLRPPERGTTGGLPMHVSAEGEERPITLADAVVRMDVHEAILRKWDTDAHGTSYDVEPYDPSEPMFRLNKSCYHDVIAQGGVIVVRRAFGDLDTPDHKPWTESSFNGWFKELLLRHQQGNTVAWQLLQLARAFWLTRAGARWMWEYAFGIAAPEAEPYTRGLIATMISHGFPLDPSPTLVTWNCAHRLPNVMRDGTQADQTPFYFPPVIQPGVFLDPTIITPVGPVDHEQVSGTVLEGMPTSEEAKTLLRVSGLRGQQETQFFKSIKKMSQSEPYFPVIDEFSTDIPGPSRHDTLRSWILSAANKAVHKPGASASHLYALFVNVADQLNQEGEKEGDRKRGWPREIWRLCTSAWQKATARKNEEDAKAEAERRESFEAKAKLEQIKAITEPQIEQGVRSWHPGLAADPVAARKWIRGRMILRARGGHYYVMRRDGLYSRVACDGEGLIPHVRRLGMDAHIDIVVESKAGPRPVRRDELAVEHVWPVERVETRPNAKGGYILDPSREEGLTLVIPSFRRRTDLVPEFSPDVDAWMFRMAGGTAELHEKHNFHHASMLAFEHGGTAVASYNCSPGAGKKLLTHGHLECMEEPEHATGDDLVQKFNGKLAHSAYLFVNEGFPDHRQQHNHPSDTLRRIITGDYFQFEGKNKDASNTKAIIRVIMTANHWRLIDALGAGRDLSPDEREAIAVRLVHYESGDAPAELLRQMGGIEWTRGWIEGDNGEPSRFVVAKHLLWLHQKYFGPGSNFKMRGRLIVEGDVNQPAIRRLRNRGGSTPAVVETLIKMADSTAVAMDHKTAETRFGMKIVDHRIFVTLGGIIDFWKRNLSNGSTERLTLRSLGVAIQGLICGDKGKMRSIEGDKGRWNEIDVVNLAVEAERLGWSSVKVDEILKARFGSVFKDIEKARNGEGDGNIIPFPGNPNPNPAAGGAP